MPEQYASTVEDFAPKETITALKGNENVRWSLPIGEIRDSTVGKHHDDWIMTDEQATEDGARVLSLSRYRDDGSIESRTNIASDLFEDYQVDVDAERRVRESWEQEYRDIGKTAVRLSLMAMVDHVRNDSANEKYTNVRAAEKQIPVQVRKLQDERLSESLHNIEDYKNAKRRENPLRTMSQGSHHKARA